MVFDATDNLEQRRSWKIGVGQRRSATLSSQPSHHQQLEEYSSATLQLEKQPD
jgi:hypothetical protein